MDQDDYNSTYSQTVLPYPYHARKITTRLPDASKTSGIPASPEDCRHFTRAMSRPNLHRSIEGPRKQMKKYNSSYSRNSFLCWIADDSGIMRRYASSHSGSSKNTLDRANSTNRHGFYLEEVSIRRASI